MPLARNRCPFPKRGSGENFACRGPVPRKNQSRRLNTAHSCPFFAVRSNRVILGTNTTLVGFSSGMLKHRFQCSPATAALFRSYYSVPRYLPTYVRVTPYLLRLFRTSAGSTWIGRRRERKQLHCPGSIPDLLGPIGLRLVVFSLSEGRSTVATYLGR